MVGHGTLQSVGCAAPRPIVVVPKGGAPRAPGIAPRRYAFPRSSRFGSRGGGPTETGSAMTGPSIAPHVGRPVVVEARAGASPQGPAPEELEVSFVLPCLNEAETLGGCIEAAMRCIRENGLSAEVIVADNGSADDSRQIAER